MTLTEFKRFLKRGGKFSVLDALWLVLLVSVFTLIAWTRPIGSAEALFFGFAFLISLLVPLGLKTGFVTQRSNLDSPYESAVRRLSALGPAARLVAGLGITLTAFSPSYTPVLLGALATLYTVAAIVLGLGYARQRQGYQRWLSTFLQDYSPTFALHTPRSDGGTYQIRMWLDPLEQLGDNFLLIVRSEEAMRNLEKITQRPILVCKSWTDLDYVMKPSIKVVFYVNSVGANADLLTYRSAKHVYLGHGDSEKPLSIHPLHAAFDYIAVAGQAAIDRYANAGLEISPDKFLRIGRPQITKTAAVFAEQRPHSEKPTLLYAPTWKGYNALSSYSSLSIGAEIVGRLIAAGYRLIFRPHPFSLQRPDERALCEKIDRLLEEDNARSDNQHLFGAKVNAAGFVDLMHVSDALIADRSSVIVDYLSTGRPIAEMEFGPHSLETGTAADHAYAYHISRTLENLETTIREMFTSDPLSTARASAAEYYLGSARDPQRHFENSVAFLFE